MNTTFDASQVERAKRLKDGDMSVWDVFETKMMDDAVEASSEILKALASYPPTANMVGLYAALALASALGSVLHSIHAEHLAKGGKDPNEVQYLFMTAQKMIVGGWNAFDPDLAG